MRRIEDGTIVIVDIKMRASKIGKLVNKVFGVSAKVRSNYRGKFTYLKIVIHHGTKYGTHNGQYNSFGIKKKCVELTMQPWHQSPKFLRVSSAIK